MEAIITVDKEGKIVLANPASHQIFGYEGNELEGLTIEDLIPDRFKPRHSDLRTSYAKHPEPRKMGEGRDLVGLKKDGSEFPIEVSLNSMKIDGTLFINAFIVDISVRKEIERTLADTRKRAQLYFEMAGVFFMVLDDKLRISLINQAGCQFLGQKQEELTGKVFHDYFVPEGIRGGFEDQVRRSLSGNDKGPVSFESEVSIASGEKLLIDWYCTRIEDSKSGSVTCLCSGIDITEQRKAEAALRSSEEKLIIYASELEQKVKERTEELANTVKKLEVSNVDLEKEIKIREKAEQDARAALEKEKELNEMKSRFVSMASHEFRTPLSTILSSASLIQKYTDPGTEERRDKHISRIKTNVVDMTSILNDFLSLEKVEGGRIDQNPEEFEIIGMLKEIADEMQLVARKEQEIQVRTKMKEKEVSFDRQLFKNIVVNLLSNAIKYSPPGKKIVVDLGYNTKGIKIAVIDEGMGIPEADQKHLFERFFRAHNATNIQGTGLGLNIVKKYLDLMKGSITFVSKQGKGTTFTVQLPPNYVK